MDDGRLEVVCGRSRSGKTYYVSREIKKLPRVFVYDPKGHPDDYPGFYTVHTLRQLQAHTIEQLKRRHNVRVRLADPGLSQFDDFCKLMFRFVSARLAPFVVVVDELSNMTTPGKAPPGWGRLCRQICGFGVSVYALTQRPAESDKTCFGNAHQLTVFKMTRADDRKYMAREMSIDPATLNALANSLEGVSTDFETVKKIKLPGSRKK